MDKVLQFADVVDAADQLTSDEQVALIGILRKRLAQVGRQLLADDILDSRKEFANGRCQPATPKELMREIQE